MVISAVSENGVLAPQLIFNIPLYDTVLQKLLAGDLYTVENIRIPKIPKNSHTRLYCVFTKKFPHRGSISLTEVTIEIVS